MRKKVLIVVALSCLIFGSGKGYCAGNIQINAHDVPLRTIPVSYTHLTLPTILRV